LARRLYFSADWDTRTNHFQPAPQSNPSRRAYFAGKRRMPMCLPTPVDEKHSEEMSSRNRMPRLKEVPPHDEVASALGELLSAAGSTQNVDLTSVSAVSGTRRPAYHLFTPRAIDETGERNSY